MKTVTCPYCQRDAEREVLPGGIIVIKCQYCGLLKSVGTEEDAESSGD